VHICWVGFILTATKGAATGTSFTHVMLSFIILATIAEVVLKNLISYFVADVPLYCSK